MHFTWWWRILTSTCSLELGLANSRYHWKFFASRPVRGPPNVVTNFFLSLLQLVCIAGLLVAFQQIAKWGPQQQQLGRLGKFTTYWCWVEKTGWLSIPIMESGSFEHSLLSTGKTIGVDFLLQNRHTDSAFFTLSYPLSWFLRTTHFAVFWFFVAVFSASICVRVGPILVNAVTGSGSFVGLRPQTWPHQVA